MLVQRAVPPATSVCGSEGAGMKRRVQARACVEANISAKACMCIPMMDGFLLGGRRPPSETLLLPQQPKRAPCLSGVNVRDDACAGGPESPKC